jgi:hypothetical protein
LRRRAPRFPVGKRNLGPKRPSEEKNTPAELYRGSETYVKTRLMLNAWAAPEVGKIMSKIETVKGVANKLFATEAAVDTAMVQAAQLLESIVEGRKALNLSAVAAEAAQSRVAESIGALAEARRAVMAAHSSLQSLQRKMGVDDADVGPLQKPDDGDKGITSEVSSLRAVS